MTTMRRGFTLIEMLVATGVFLLGFSAAYTLFLAGVRYRTQAEATQRMAFALTSLVEELSLSSGARTTGVQAEPQAYLGGGLAINPTEVPPPDPMDTALFAYPDLPGIFYRVMAVSDMHGQTTDTTPTTGLLPSSTTATLHARVLVIAFASDDITITFKELQRRYQIDQSTVTDPTALAAALVDRGLAMQCETVILRRPSWL